MNKLLVWEGRSWIDVNKNNDGSNQSINLSQLNRNTFTITNYHVFANSKSNCTSHTSIKSWDIRSQTLLAEIKAYNSDVITCQDVDHFADFWRPQLAILGYDSVYKNRTCLKDTHNEGVFIAYKRDLFQLFKTIKIEFNDASNESNSKSGDLYSSVFKERMKTDDVGILLFLQPYIHDFLSSAICVVCAMLSDSYKNSDIRMVQSQYLTQQIELANREFHLPIVMGISLHDSPSSLAYNLLRTGRIPLLAQVPKKCKKAPVAKSTSRSSLQLNWYPPILSLADPPITSYRISWRPGGSNILGFRSQVDVPIADCVKYVEVIDENRNKRIVAQKELQYVVSGLSSDVPYEFRIAAVNAIGEGAWSDVSLPVAPVNPINAPIMPSLILMKTLTELNETREGCLMEIEDNNVLLIVPSDPVNSLTQLTPRDINGRETSQVPRGRILPPSSNPRESWKSSLGAYESYSIGAEPMYTAALPKTANNPNSIDCIDYIFYDSITLKNLRILSIPMITELANENIQELYNVPNIHSIHPSNHTKHLYDELITKMYKKLYPSSHITNIDDTNPELMYEVFTKPNHEILPAPTVTKINEAKKHLKNILKHSGQVKMASAGDKPFESKHDGKHGSHKHNIPAVWCGHWIPEPTVNPHRNTHWLPNESYCSTHIALCAEFQINNNNLATNWTA
eukprot:gene4561-6433_t